ncbi:MAG: hypothetical protein M3340_11775 [Actinomycetota bacterium]|nr:hypothetical protein [Actinomycetota bacterium]
MPLDALPLADSTLVPAVVGLVGVVIGAVVNGVAQYLVQRRRELYELRSHARLVGADLHRAEGIVRQLAERPMDRPPGVGDELASPAWVEGRGVLARGLQDPQWTAVREAFDGIAQFRRGLAPGDGAGRTFDQAHAEAEATLTRIEAAHQALRGTG